MPGVARVGDTHGGICHGNPVVGTIVEGSPNVITNGRRTARLNDGVVHNCPVCGTGNISSSSRTVLANGIGVARLGDSVAYPGGGGIITSASGDTFAGG